MIGPVLPYRGGIAQHTTMLHRALNQQIDCLTISFSRQYHPWLFPGKSDRDGAWDGHAEEGVEYLIDSVNPLTWPGAVRRGKAFSPSLVVFPWWHVYWAPCFSYLASAFVKSGIETVFLCHNVIEHENGRWKQQLTRIALSHADRFVVHTSADRMNLLERFPGVRIDVYPHPVYEQFPDATEAFPRRAKLELLFFGLVRPYKGLDILLEAMRQLGSEDVFLSIVGEFWEGEEWALGFVERHGLQDRIEMVSRYVSDQEAANYFQRSDVVVLPYRSATGSGVVPLAYRYGKPVIVTRVGGLPDVVDEGRTGRVIDPDSPGQLANAIREMLSGRSGFTAEGIDDIRSRFTWTGLAEAVLGRKDGPNVL